MRLSRPGVDAATFQPRRFRIVRCIGSGATGDVYEAVDRETGAQVALKTLRVPTHDALALLKNEFRVVQDLHHPNLVQIRDLVNERATKTLLVDRLSA